MQNKATISRAALPDTALHHYRGGNDYWPAVSVKAARLSLIGFNFAARTLDTMPALEF